MNCKVIVRKGVYAVAKTRKACPGAFANVEDGKEITVIAEEGAFREADVLAIEKGWKVLTFDTVLPFETVGFLANISKLLAEEKISIFAVSSYSTDHILIKEKDLEKAAKKLEKTGCFVVER